MPYLDIIKLLKDNTNLPISAYHVSGEYAMLKAAAERVSTRFPAHRDKSPEWGHLKAKVEAR
jgi:hypothetical protein